LSLANPDDKLKHVEHLVEPTGYRMVALTSLQWAYLLAATQ
jgi:hypothetical protein